MEESSKKYISWPVLAMMAFVTVIGFEDIMYNFKNQGMGVITSWIIMMFLYVVPYALMVGQLGSVFNSEGGGLSSWIRGTNGEFLGYFTAWTYWAASIPYVVDSAQSVIVGFGWAFTGSSSFQNNMPNSIFTLLTFIVFIIFIFIQRHLSNSMEILSTIGGFAMFGMTVLFVFMSIVGLIKSGGHMATQPMNIHTLLPKFDLKYLTTIGLLIYAVNGAELVAPFVTQMRKPKVEFPKAMITLALMTTFLTIFGSFSLGIFFDANHLPNDLKMNGDYYAFQALGRQYGVGNVFMYIYAWTSVIYMCALLAVLLDAMTRMLISDTGEKYMPAFLRKKNADGLPINGYILTCTLSGFIMLLGVFLPEMNDIFNWLLNLNGIISPGVTCWIFYAFMRIRKNPEKYPSEYVFIKNDKFGYIAGLLLLVVTAAATLFGVAPQDVPAYSGTWWYELTINFIAIVILIGLGAILPLIRKREVEYGVAFNRKQWSIMIGTTLVAVIAMVWLGGTHLAIKIGLIITIGILAVLLLWLVGRKKPINVKQES
ncbi:amino acid permease [Ligilactobacillus acidipiscis DSM 15836]|uniref:Amino acid permease n=2 Tax=Ligilactobacillus acidipiscis TaxID=89059 RepID=A0A0R2K7E8_9LACO|nr:amino acid permease [Ligilactobacillus acidipiscis]KRM20080.1 amino acid permease [Ligilactobacillus acidipiscis DSM 15836]KRN83782.1 amino acid permease [Ligilactobacillus acidipiscis]SFV40838.1 Amino acid permease [Ligilactobacillus acidipiscis]GAW64386.1 amino acid permease [Ligilactobacillus acidipiscis]GEN21971.1 amino acid permease [Ligilactobacillus acidipiscis]